MRPRPVKTRSPELLCYCGINAVNAIFTARREDIARLSLTKPAAAKLEALVEWCRSRDKPVQIVSQDRIAVISKSTHHEGVALLARKRPVSKFDPRALPRAGDRCLIVALDGVANPHNFGTVLRNGAHFGVSIVLGRSGEMPALSAAACRVAEGGAEAVDVRETGDLPGALRRLAASGFEIIATSSRAAASLFDLTFPKRAVLILGAEGTGISPELEKIAARRVVIPGSGAVESLNVASASAVLLGEWYRQTAARGAG